MCSDGAAFLEAAAVLARRITDAAVWAEGRCNWVGALGREGALSSGHAAVAALGPDLYEGTSGVALFLAEAAVRLDEPGLRATALGAIRLALEQGGRAGADGLYSGRPGIAYAAGRVARLLSAEDVAASAEALIPAGRDGAERPWAADVMRGRAGTVVALVALGRPTAAAVLGDELIARAERRRAGCSWGDPRQPSMHHLCGYAHGASGVGHALAELYGATGEARFRAAAGRAFAYERSWLDPRSGTWPDLRGVTRRVGRQAPVPAAHSWCNGSGGIVLARVRARELLGGTALRRDANLALAACERHAAGLLGRSPDDFSLCHGAAGAADVLLGAGRAELAAQVGLLGLDRHGRPGAPGFPCGVPVGETPALMVGLAGVGLFYLRLADRSVESPLLVGLTRGSRGCESRGTRGRSEP
jgi:lantibiotic biosynthesis protein